MKTMKLLGALGLLMLPALMVQAGPALNVGGLYDYMEGGRSTVLKRIRNGGDSTAFVKVSVVELIYDGNGEAREVDLDQQPIEQRAVVASPARLIVPAQGMQAIRLLYRGTRDKERYFRLRFMPVLPRQGDGFALSEDEARQYGDSLKAGVQLLAGYGTLLFVHPEASRYDTPVRMQGGRLVVTNQGTATVVLDHFRHCTPDGRECATATKHHLLPGRSREFPGQPGREYRFDLYEGDRRKEMTIKG